MAMQNNMADENFAKAPETIGEARADRSGQAKDWTVREMLISTLRKIDSGEIEPLKAVLVFSLPPIAPTSGHGIAYKCASIDQDYEALGLLSQASMLLFNH